jgi:peptidyl-prolyl cis-trans isomerase B (cyclophilin B)
VAYGTAGTRPGDNRQMTGVWHVASKKDRQRKLERERAQRRIARQAHRTRRRRQIYAGVSAGLTVLIIALGVTWAMGGFDPDPPSNIIAGDCNWKLRDLAAEPAYTDVGHPPATGIRREGTETMTITTSLGEIQAQIDLAKAPCAAASFAYLGEKGFFANSSCHRLNQVLGFLACGDPKSDGSGGPGYTFNDEDVPVEPLSGDASASPSAPSPSASAPASAPASASASPSAGPQPRYYAKGTIVMANTGANTNGSQFYIVYDDESTLGNAYSIVGTVTKGLDIVERVAKGGATDAAGADVTEGKPKTALVLQSITVGTPSASPSATPSASPTPSAQS